MENLERLVKDKVVLITCGSSGIGLATAQRIAAAGAITVICGRDPRKLAEARRRIQAPDDRVFAYEVNLADLAQCDALVARCLRDHGHVDLLINNAGRSIRRTVAGSLDRFHDLQRTMALNYFGALRVTMGLLPSMARRRSGHIINISSIGVLTGAPRFSAYVASKAALDAWTRCAASEYADLGIEFTTINMPLVKTPMIAPTRVYADVPALSPDEAAALVVDAIVRRPARVATPWGRMSDALHTFLPGAARALMSRAFLKSVEDEGGDDLAAARLAG